MSAATPADRDDGPSHGEPADGPRLHRWRDPPVLGVALLLVATGFAQFSPAAALADVAAHFGQLGDGDSIAEQAGLPGTTLGAGLAVIRLSALVALPLAALADRSGRRRTLLTWVTVGLAITAAAAFGPGYWWFVLALALARPLLTATGTVAQVVAAEHTPTAERAKALALLAAAYGVGAGGVAVLRAVAGDQLGMRGVFLATIVLLGLVAAAGRLTTEPDRFRRRAATDVVPPVIPVRSVLGRAHRRPLVALGVITFAAGFITGPATTFLFVYAENVLGASAVLTGALVLVAGVTGLAGLLLGRFLADRLGRRPTGAIGLVLLATMAVVTYSGSIPAVAVGYPAGVLVGSVFGTPTMALAAELFPTAIRASVAGWLVVTGVLGATSGLLVAGALADATDSFTTALLAVGIPGGLASGCFVLLDETRLRDLEDAEPA